jgi:2-keto-4-pentenoate hydratase
MDKAAALEASELLTRCWREGAVIDALPADLRPASRAEGYAIQAEIERESKRPLFGWKIAATSAAGQKHIGVDGPLAGRLLAERVDGDGDVIPFGANRMRVAECEFAFRMGRDLPPRDAPYERDEALAAVADLHLAIEVPDSRYADFATAGGPQIVADNACAHLFVLGAKAPPLWRELDLATHRVHAKVGRRYERDGIGANVLGHPLIALTWLANELSGLGVTLAAGQVVTTGTCMIPLEIEPGDTVTADYGVIGRVSCSFSAA